MSLLRKWFSQIIHFFNKTSDEALDSSIYNCLSVHSFFSFCCGGYALFDFFVGLRDARVMWDQKTGRSRGFGFVSFRNQQVAF